MEGLEIFNHHLLEEIDDEIPQFEEFTNRALKCFMEYEPLDFVPLADMHWKWTDAMSDNKRVSIIAFRESMKSTMALVKASYLMMTTPNLRLMLASSNMTKAVRRLQWFDEFVQRYPRLRAMRDNSRWSSSQKIFTNGARISASAVGVAMEGERVHGAILDDILEEFPRFSDEKVIHWMTQVVVPFLLPKAWMWLLQTQKRLGDITDWVGENPAWISIRQPITDPEGNPVWEEYWDEERIEGRRTEMPKREFESEYMLNCLSDETAVVPFNTIQPCLEPQQSLDDVPKGWDVVMGVDLAVGMDVANDETAYCVVAFNRETKERKIVHLWSGRIQAEGFGWLSAQVDNLKSLAEQFNPRVIMVESNGYQRLVHNAAKETAGLPVQRHNTGSEKHHGSVGIPSIAFHMEQRRYQIPYDRDAQEKLQPLIRGLTGLTYGLNGKLMGHTPDTVISLWMCELAIQTLEKKDIFVTKWDYF